MKKITKGVAIESLVPGADCVVINNSEIRWLSKDNNPYHLPENDEMWWGAWSLEVVSESR